MAQDRENRNNIAELLRLTSSKSLQYLKVIYLILQNQIFCEDMQFDCVTFWCEQAFTLYSGYTLNIKITCQHKRYGVAFLPLDRARQTLSFVLTVITTVAGQLYKASYLMDSDIDLCKKANKHVSRMSNCFFNFNFPVVIFCTTSSNT